jgi:hypothetical protein
MSLRQVQVDQEKVQPEAEVEKEADEEKQPEWAAKA